jgi:hypothetical protein
MAMTSDDLRRRPWLIALLLLVLGLPQSPLMAMSAAMPHVGAHMHTLGGAMHHTSMKHAHHHRHPDHCPQCSVCGACCSAASPAMISAVHFTSPLPAASSSVSPTEVYLPPDPFPPRS